MLASGKAATAAPLEGVLRFAAQGSMRRLISSSRCCAAVDTSGTLADKAALHAKVCLLSGCWDAAGCAYQLFAPLPAVACQQLSAAAASVCVALPHSSPHMPPSSGVSPLPSAVLMAAACDGI